MTVSLAIPSHTHAFNSGEKSPEFLMGQIDTEIPEDQLEEYALQLNAKDFAYADRRQKENH